MSRLAEYAQMTIGAHQCPLSAYEATASTGESVLHHGEHGPALEAVYRKALRTKPMPGV